jgi:hypothetical protein
MPRDVFRAQWRTSGAVRTVPLFLRREQRGPRSRRRKPPRPSCSRVLPDWSVLLRADVPADNALVSLTIDIELPGLTRDSAIALDRAADLAGTPLEFRGPRKGGRIRGPRPASVVMRDLRDDPSIASEALDHSEGWPQAQPVREWLIRVARFLAEHAPEGGFRFRAGWGDHQPSGVVELDIDAFLDAIAAGELQADRLYEVRARS